MGLTFDAQRVDGRPELSQPFQPEFLELCWGQSTGQFADYGDSVGGGGHASLLDGAASLAKRPGPDAARRLIVA